MNNLSISFFKIKNPAAYLVYTQREMGFYYLGTKNVNAHKHKIPKSKSGTSFEVQK
jgi:hypothetical protein